MNQSPLQVFHYPSTPFITHYLIDSHHLLIKQLHSNFIMIIISFSYLLIPTLNHLIYYDLYLHFFHLIIFYNLQVHDSLILYSNSIVIDLLFASKMLTPITPSDLIQPSNLDHNLAAIVIIFSITLQDHILFFAIIRCQSRKQIVN